MNKWVNKILWVLSFIAIAGMLSFAEKKKTAEVCKGIAIDIQRPNSNYFVLEEDVEELISNMGYAAIGMRVNDIDITQIEKLLNNNPSISKAEVYTTIDGIVAIEMVQRTPLIRIFNQNGESFYIDDQGWLMPLSEKYTARAIVANGNINTSFAPGYKTNVKEVADSQYSILHELYVLAKYIRKNAFWKSQITQVHVNNIGDIELIPRVGNHNIVIGDTTDLEKKFNKLMVFYKEGLNRTGWNNYKTINLKYQNQVVCTKK